MGIATKIVLYGGFLALLFLVSLQNYLLFHSLAELFSIVIAFGIFVIGWNSRKYYKNNYLLFIGIAYLFVAFFDTLHTLAYKGMNIFHGYDDNNLPPQLWLVARYMESIALLLAPTFFNKPVRHWRIVSVLTVISALAIYAIFFADIFPVCFVTGSGLTPFKVGSEYLIDLILCAALYMLYRYKAHFEPGVVKLLTLSIVCTMVTELCFTVYVHLYGISNLIGHFFKILSFWFMYKAIIETALGKPYDLLFRELHTSEKQFSNAFHFAPIGIALVQPNGRWLKVNRVVCAMLGYTEDELLSKTFQDITHPDDLEADLDQVRQMLDGPIASYQAEKRYVHKNGSAIWVLRSTSLVRDDDGNPQHFITQIINITDRKTIEMVQTFLAGRGWMSSDEEFFPALARFLSELLSLEFICIDRLIGDGHMARTVAVYHNGKFEDNVEYALKDTPCGEVVGKIICCFPRDVVDLFPNDPVLREINAQSYAGITLWGKEEKPIGLIALIGEKPFANQALVETVLHFVAPRATGELERMLAEEVLRESENRYRTLFDFGMDGVVVIDPETTRLIDFNDLACRQLGYTREEFSLLSLVDIESMEPPEVIKSHIERIVATGYDEFETMLRAKQGDARNVHVKARYTIINGKNVCHCIWRDITQRKKDEQLAAARLHLIEYGLVHTLDELLTETLNRIEDLTGSLIGFYHFVQEEQGTLTLHAWSTRTARDFCTAEGSGSHYEIQKAGVWGDCIHERRPVVHNDYASLPHRKGMPAGHATVIRQMAVPIIRSGSIVGVIGIGNKPSNYTEDDISLVSHFADLAWDIAERKQIIDSLGESNERFEAAFKNAPMMIAISRLEDHTYLDVNQRFLDLFGFSREEVIGKTSVELGLVSEADQNKLREAISRDGRIIEQEFSICTKSGQQLSCVNWCEMITFSGQKRLLSIAMDITARKHAEEEKKALQSRLIQVQKMEAIGTLAGGIAHDFNNILGAIIGYTEIARDEVPPESSIAKSLNKVLDASQRATALVKQILAFSRQVNLQRIPLNISHVVKDTIKLLRPSIPSTIEIRQQIDSSFRPILADSTQVHQIIMNLCTNAYHAMEQTGGVLQITIEDVELSLSDLQKHPGVQPGGFVKLSISDTGAGIDADIRSRIFEPYFTTKEVGKGTGMGLSIVHGIVASYGGFVTCESEIGKGTVFNIFFPAIEEQAASEVKPMELTPSGTERILFIDDEEILAEMGKTMLEQLGYDVTISNSSIEALAAFQNQPDQFDVVITDQTMPGMTGFDFAKRLLQIRPNIPIILCTGYSNLVNEEQAKIVGIKGFIMKPMSKKEIAKCLRAVLDENRIAG